MHPVSDLSEVEGDAPSNHILTCMLFVRIAVMLERLGSQSLLLVLAILPATSFSACLREK